MSPKRTTGTLKPAQVQIISAVYHYRFLRVADVMRLLFPTEPGTSKGKRTRVIAWIKALVEGEYLGSQSYGTEELFFLERNGRDALASTGQMKADEIDWRSDHHQLGAAEVAHLLLTNEFKISVELAVQRKATAWSLMQSSVPVALKAEALDLLLRQGYSPQRLKQRLEYVLWQMQTGSLADPVQALRQAIAKGQMAKPAGFVQEALKSPFAGKAGYELTEWLTNLQLKRLQSKQKLTSHLGDLYPDYEFGLKIPGGKEFPICVEIDRGTENLSNPSMPYKDSSIATKVEKYVQVVFDRPSSYEQARGKRENRPRIWFITTRSPERLANMLRTMHEAGAGDLFAVISHHCARPELLLERPVWQLAKKGPGHYVTMFGPRYLDELEKFLAKGQVDPSVIERYQDTVLKHAAKQLEGWNDRSGIPDEVAQAIRADRLAEAWLEGLSNSV